MNLFYLIDKFKEEIMKYKTVITVLLFVPAFIFSTFLFTTCNITCKVEKSEHLAQQEELYRDSFIQNYERKHQNHQLSLKDDISIRGKQLKLYLDSVDNDNRAKMNSLFSKWRETMEKQHDNLIELEEASNKNFSIWLAVIAAICTVLPVVLALHQNQTFSTTIQGVDKKIELQSNNINKLSARIEITTLLDMISRNLNILSDMQELDNGENIKLTCPDEVHCYTKLICDSSQKCVNKYDEISSKLQKDDIELIYNAGLCTLCTLRGMLYRFENTFTGGNLIVLQKIRYDVIMNIREVIRREEDIKDHTTKELLKKIHTYTNLVSNIFN